MKDLSKLTSLERYVRTRGQHLVGGSPSYRNYLLQFWIGSGLLAVGFAIVLVAAITQIGPIALGAIGPIIAGMVNILVSVGLRKRFPQNTTPSVAVSPEARTMLKTLSWTYIWSKNPWVWNPQMNLDPNALGNHQVCARGHHTHHAQHHFGGAARQDALAALPDQVLGQMEDAAFQYNRTLGALEAGAAGGNLQRLATKVVQGADEAMLDVLHQAQLVSRYPEGVKTIEARLTSGVGTLRELADRVETLALREPTFTDMMSRRNTADEVLEELRLEQAAFTELSSPDRTDDPLRQTLQE